MSEDMNKGWRREEIRREKRANLARDYRNSVEIGDNFKQQKRGISILISGCSW